MDPQARQNVTVAPGGTAVFWESATRKSAVFIDFEVVDRLGFDVMRGFGAVPRRGAEVGGILLGTVENGDQAAIRIEDYVPVSCEHLRGPSFILSDADKSRLEETLGRWRRSGERRIYAIGFYRSNTRDGLLLGKEDFELLDELFPDPFSVCLLIKPYTTTASQAAFIVREDGAFTTPEEPSTFPFRRKELGGGAPAGRPGRGRPAPPDTGGGSAEAAPVAMSPAGVPEAASEPSTVRTYTPPASASMLGLTSTLPEEPPARQDEGGSVPEAPPSRFRSGWVWLPLSFIFLLLGVVLGFQIAIGYRSSQPADPAADPYLLDLSAVKFGENIHLKWNTEAAAMKRAQRGVLTIDDGGNAKTVELSKDDLGRGSVLYRHVSGTVRFRLDIFPRERNTVSEMLDVRLVADTTSDDRAGEAEAKTSRPESRRNPRRK
jgi:hypothetical protein